MKNLPKHLVCALLTVVMCGLISIRSACSAQTIASALDSCTRYREDNFRECHFIIGITDEGPDGTQDTIVVESWVKGVKIRNDVNRGGKQSHAVVSGDEYILCIFDSTTADLSKISKDSSAWEHLGIIHPASIGMTSGGLGLYKGRNVWLLNAKDDWANQALNDDSLEGKQVLSGKLRFSKKHPESLPAHVPVGSAGVRDYLANNPDVPILNFDVAKELYFDSNLGGQLVRYVSSQTISETDTTTDIILDNKYYIDENTGIVVPSSSAWSVYSNGRLLEKRTTIVREAAFGPVSDSVFTVEGLDLSDDFRVRDRVGDGPPKHGTIVNGKVVYGGPVLEPTNPGDRKSDRSFKVFIGVNFLFFAIALIIWQLLRIKSARQQEPK